MKWNQKRVLTLVTLTVLTFGSHSAWARHHWNNGSGMGPQGYNQLTTEQQATAQKMHNDFYEQTRVLRQQLTSKRYEYNALLTVDKPDSAKIESVAQEMKTLDQKLAQQRVKFDVALAQAGIPRGEGMGRGSCGRVRDHMGRNHW